MNSSLSSRNRITCDHKYLNFVIHLPSECISSWSSVLVLQRLRSQQRDPQSVFAAQVINTYRMRVLAKQTDREHDKNKGFDKSLAIEELIHSCSKNSHRLRHNHFHLILTSNQSISPIPIAIPIPMPSPIHPPVDQSFPSRSTRAKTINAWLRNQMIFGQGQDSAMVPGATTIYSPSGMCHTSVAGSEEQKQFSQQGVSAVDD